MSLRQLETVDYHLWCSGHGLVPAGIHKIACDDGRPGVLIDASIVPYIMNALQYKFSNFQIDDQNTNGVLVSWIRFKEPERDRFYLMCVYMLRNVLPELWESENGR